MSLDLTTDCSACVGLCCKAFQFEKGSHFSIDKEAGMACPHLGGDFGCTIHADRVAKGFSGCLVFDCQGAGQRMVQEVFVNHNWEDPQPITTRVIDAFRILRDVHKLYELVDVSDALPLTESLSKQRAGLLEDLGTQPATEAWLMGFEQSALPKRAMSYLKSLATLVPRP